MPKVQVSNFKIFSIVEGRYVVSKFMAPLEKIENLKGEPIKGTVIEIDDSLLNGDGFYLPPEAQ